MDAREYHDFGQQKSRIKTVLICIVAFGAIILLRLFWLQVIKHSYYMKIASEQHWVRDVIQAKRGKIYVKDNTASSSDSSSDQEGLYPLAENQTLALAFAAPEEIQDKAGAAKKIAPILEMDEGEIKELLENNHTYVPLKHKLSHETEEKVKSLNIRGIGTSPEQWRYWPEGKLASQLLGFVDADGNGKYGLEQYFNDELKGENGLYKAEIDAKGTRIAFGNNVLVPPKEGTSLVLSVNRDVQMQAEKLIEASVKKYSAAGGSIIVMNPDNGEIIAMANTPTYDLNKYGEQKDYSVFRNTAVTDEYEPGSIFKIITMAAGLDTKKVEPDTKYEDTGSVTLNGNKIMNATKKTYGWVDMTYVIQESLNTGVVYVLNQIGKPVFYDYMKRFGLGVLTGIEQSGESAGKVISPEEVNDHTYATMTFGQSVSTTAIQMITSFAAIANGGKLVKPHLVTEKIYKDGKKEKVDSRPIREVISAETAAKERQMMVNQVEKGHGGQAKVKGYKVAGKTGTAQVPRKDGRGYDSSKNIGSFIGFGPADSPRFIVMAKVDYPKGVPWAEESAAPVVGQILDFLFKYYQVPPIEPI